MRPTVIDFDKGDTLADPDDRHPGGCCDKKHEPDPLEATKSLSLGEASSDVRWLQGLLRTIGFRMLVDGYYGPETERRVRAFQEGYAMENLQVSGQADAYTRRAIICSAANNGRLSPNFYFGEFRSKQSGEIRVNRELPIRLEKLRAAQCRIKGNDWALPILTSFRDPRTQAARQIRGVSQSRHLHGEAVDIPIYYDLDVSRLIPRPQDGPDHPGPVDEPTNGFTGQFSGIGYYQRTGLVRHLDVGGTHHQSLDTSKVPDDPRCWAYDEAWDPVRFREQALVMPTTELQRDDSDRTPLYELVKRVDGDLLIVGRVEGDLHLAAEVTGNVLMAAEVTGDVTVTGAIGGSIWFPSHPPDHVGDFHGPCGINGSLDLHSAVTDEVIISCEIGAFVRLWNQVGGSFRFEGRCGRTISIKYEASIGRNLWITGGFGIEKLERDISDRSSPHPFSGDDAVGRDLIVDGTVLGDVGINGAVGGSVWINQEAFDVVVSGLIKGDLRVPGTIKRNLSIWHDGTDVRFSTGYNHGAVEGTVWIEGEVAETLWLTGRVGQNLQIDGKIGALNIEGTVGRGYVHVALKASVRAITITDDAVINRGTWIEGTCIEDIVIRGDFGNTLFFSGRARHLDVAALGGRVWLDGAITGGGRLRRSIVNDKDGPMLEIDRLATNLDAPLFLGTGVSLAPCDLRYFTDYDHLRLVGSDLFSRDKRGRRVLSFAYDNEENHTEKADIYRRMRSVLERQANRAGAGDFYHGEMEARRKAAWHRWRATPDSLPDGAEYLILVLYRLLSGYGLIAGRALLALAVVSVLATFGFVQDGIVISEDRGPAGWVDSWLFTVRSMVSLVFPVSARLSPGGHVIQIVCRILGPLLLAQTFLAVRERVAR